MSGVKIVTGSGCRMVRVKWSRGEVVKVWSGHGGSGQGVKASRRLGCRGV